MSESRKQNYLSGAAILALTVAITKIIGLIYKYPILNILGDAGTTHFDVTYRVYNLLLTISTAGIPVALSRLISAADATGRNTQVKRYFNVGMLTFVIIGAICSSLMIFFPQQIAEMMGDPGAAMGIAVLGPGVLFVCIISVYRGYSQGFSNMLPTALSQIIEVVFKAIIGISIALWLSSMNYDSAAVSAGAIMGVTVGLGISIPVLMIEKHRSDRKRGTTLTMDKPISRKETLKEILAIGIPITLSASLLNIISVIDTKLILDSLQNRAGFDTAMTEILYGVYAKGVNVANIPSAIIVPLTVSIVPAISAALAKKHRGEAKEVMESSMRVSNLIAMPAAVGLAVLSYPIFQVLFPGSHEAGPALLSILGIGTYFICIQLIMNAILQASGHEKFALISLPVGGAVKIITNYILVSNPEINIYGAPVGTLLCYVAIVIMDIIFIKVKMKESPSFFKVSIRPLICSLIMGAGAWAVYGIASRYAGELVSMVCGVAVAVVIYFVLVIVLKAITRDDLKLLPKGEKIADILRIK